MLERGSVDYRVNRDVQASANFRSLLVSVLAALIGIAAGIIAFILYNLIGYSPTSAFYQRFSFNFVRPQDNHLG